MQRSLELGNSKLEGKTKRKEGHWLNAGAKFGRDIGSLDAQEQQQYKKIHQRQKRNFKEALLWPSSPFIILVKWKERF